MKKILSALSICLLFPINILAYSEYVIPGGENIGISIESKGLMVIGFYKVKDKYIASENLKVGDVILSVAGKEVNSIEEMTTTINEKMKDNKVKVTILRNKKQMEVTLDLYEENGVYKTGLYVKDKLNGIGTLTYIDPNTKIYGALGHEIIESNTKQIIEVKKGNIYESLVTSIERSVDGRPGSKNANINYKNNIGTIKKNTTAGIYGKFNSNFPNKETIKVASFDEIKKGKAYIYTNINEDEIKTYEINITGLDKTKIHTSKAISFEITDEELLSETGGIVQGMSGSPIIQNDKIIGAVTHVIIDNVHNGYGIFIRTMLEEGEK